MIRVLVALLVTVALMAPSTPASARSIDGHGATPDLVAHQAPAARAAARVRECTARTPYDRRPALRPGDVGTCVVALQNLLLTHGYRLGFGWPGGEYDANTRRAVERMQRHHDLAVTGRVGPRVWATLRDAPLGTGYTRWRGPNRTDRVVLSYDDCPRSWGAFRDTVLAAERRKVALVLFPTGHCLQSGRFSAAFARDHGHWVFNHSVSHPDLRDLSLDAVRRELRAPGVVTSLGRPPYGALDAVALTGYRREEMRPWLWTYDTQDWTGLSRAQVVRGAVAQSTERTTVLMHLGWHGFSPSAVRDMKRGLAARGLQVCRNRGVTPVRPKTLRC